MLRISRGKQRKKQNELVLAEPSSSFSFRRMLSWRHLEIEQQHSRIGVAVKPGCDAMLKWVLENSYKEQQQKQKQQQQQQHKVTLVYVLAPLVHIRAPMGGGKVLVSQVSPHIVAEHSAALKSKIEQFHQHLQGICSMYTLEADFIALHDEHVGRALVEQISKSELTIFFLGASPRSVKKKGISYYVMEHAPGSCAIQCLSKSLRLVCSRGIPGRIPVSDFEVPFETGEQPDNYISQPLPRLPSRLHPLTSKSYGSVFPCFQAEDVMDVDDLHEGTSKKTRVEPKCSFEKAKQQPCSADSSSSTIVDGPVLLQDDAAEASSSQRESTELESLKLQLQKALHEAELARQNEFLQAARCKEALRTMELAKKQAQELAQQRLEEARLKDAAVTVAEMASERFQEEAKMHKETQKNAEFLRDALEEEKKMREEVENRLSRDIESRISRQRNSYTQFTYQELDSMTGGFSEKNRLGTGGYGDVFKGSTHDALVAVKVLKQDGLQGSNEFRREVDLLSRYHHPHIVRLLGYCSEQSCIVYEYMENGSLEDMLFQKGNRPAIPWHSRFRIAAEVATGLLFLHNAKPLPIVHRDLKPSNILLDRAYRSKISDIGLAKFIPSMQSVVDTSPVGTFSYIDPEYLRDGSFGPKSDLYALGIVMLQLLTGNVATGITSKVAKAIHEGSLCDVLDKSAGDWPLAEAMQVAYLSLSCTEMERKNRPELEEVLSVLEHVNDSLFRGDLFRTINAAAPALFQCPILQEVMEFPVIASDGYTYETRAIREWLENHDTSPMTNLPLRDKSLTANRLIRSAICEWRGSHLT